MSQKLTETEIKSLTDLQTTYQTLQLRMGGVTFQENELKILKEKIFQETSNLRSSEAELAKELEEKYGVGSISLETGEFMSSESTEE